MKKEYWVGNEHYKKAHTALAVATDKRDSVLAQLRHKKMVSLPNAFRRTCAQKKQYYAWLSSHRKGGKDKQQFLLSGLSIMRSYVNGRDEYAREVKAYKELKAHLAQINADIAEIKAQDKADKEAS